MNELIKANEPKTAVMIRREIAQEPSVLQSLKGVDRTIFLASTDKTVAEIPGIELTRELNKLLRVVCKDIGYRITDEGDIQYLVVRISELMKRYYANLTLKDFRLAFEMSITGELDDYLPKRADGTADRQHYQNFNSEYVCRILNAYRDRRSQTLVKVIDARPKMEADPVRIQEAELGLKKDIIKAYNYFLENREMPQLSPLSEMCYYERLRDVGLAPEIIVTDEERQKAFQEAVEFYEKRGKTFDARRVREAGIDTEEIEASSRFMAAGRVLAECFEDIRKQGLSIEKYL